MKVNNEIEALNALAAICKWLERKQEIQIGKRMI
jgi:hypothetical protein